MLQSMPTFNCNGIPEILSFIWQWFKWFISMLNHFILLPSIGLSMLDLIIVVTVIGLIIDAIFVVFSNAAADAFDF